MPQPTEYDQLKAAGLSDHNIMMLRNTGASFSAILAYAKSQPKYTTGLYQSPE